MGLWRLHGCKSNSIACVTTCGVRGSNVMRRTTNSIASEIVTGVARVRRAADAGLATIVGATIATTDQAVVVGVIGTTTTNAADVTGVRVVTVATEVVVGGIVVRVGS